VCFRHSAAFEPLQSMLVDEAQHAALAWATIRWAVARGASLAELPHTRANVRAAVLPSLTADGDAEAMLLLRGGKLPESMVDAITAAALDRWVVPWRAAMASGALPRASSSRLTATLASAAAQLYIIYESQLSSPRFLYCCVSARRRDFAASLQRGVAVPGQCRDWV
jgi:hypothetical protein